MASNGIPSHHRYNAMHNGMPQSHWHIWHNRNGCVSAIWSACNFSGVPMTICWRGHKVHKIGVVLPLGLQFCQDGSSDNEVTKVVVVVLGGHQVPGSMMTIYIHPYTARLHPYTNHFHSAANSLGLCGRYTNHTNIKTLKQERIHWYTDCVLESSALVPLGELICPTLPIRIYTLDVVLPVLVWLQSNSWCELSESNISPTVSKLNTFALRCPASL